MAIKCRGASRRVGFIGHRWRLAALLALTLIPVAGSSRPAALATTSDGRTWTLEDIVEVPRIVGVSIAEDGGSALYVVRRGDLSTNTRTSQLRRVDLDTGTDRMIRASPWFDALERIPGSHSWSLLADIGDGVQLYRIDGNGTFTPLAVNRDTDLVSSGNEAAIAFGILRYGWASEKEFWYEKRTSGQAGARIVNPRYFPVSKRGGTGSVELRFVRGSRDLLVDRIEAPSSGFLRVGWDAGTSTLSYWVRLRDESLEKRLWSPGGTARKAGTEGNGYVPDVEDGQGRFQVTGYGDARKLLLKKPDGSTREYGRVAFGLGYPPLTGTWWSSDGKIALLGTRQSDLPRYGLARLTAEGTIEELAEPSSLTQCSVNGAFTVAACVRQSMTSPPELVTLDPRAGGVHPVVALAPGYSSIVPLKVVPKRWTNRYGFAANGFVVYPRNYQPGRAYPTIVVTHGSDADERFVYDGLQWSYPVQVWAERGYVVVTMNDPSPRDSADLMAAYEQWGGSRTSLPPERVQDLVWINGVLSFEDAIKELAAEGLVDLGKVGIAGYSRGSQMVNVTMTQSRLFRAASSGDGGYLEPQGYFVATQSYRQVFGGSPFDPATVENYRRLSPTFRAAQASGPILQQVALGTASQLSLHVALQQAGVPSELVYYPDETHLFHQPRNLLTSMQENLDWFDFWLLGKEDPDSAKKAQYQRWRMMREQWKH